MSSSTNLDTNIVDSYLYENTETTNQLKEYLANHMNQASYIPNVDTVNNQSFFSQLDTVFLQSWYTFIYLKSNLNSNFLYYLDKMIFGDQTSIPVANRLAFYSHYRKEDGTGTSLFTPLFFKEVWWADKTDENEKAYLYLDEPTATLKRAYEIYIDINAGKPIQGTVLESYQTFKQKWTELVQSGFLFQTTHHHPVFDGTHNWNSLPLSLRRKYRSTTTLGDNDLYMIIVNCAIAPILHDFFTTETSGETWDIYNAHALPANEFDPRYFRVPGPSTICKYVSLPAIWNRMNGVNEIKGKWQTVQFILSRMTHILRLAPYQMTDISDSITTTPPTQDEIQRQIRDVDRTQRFLCGYTQTLNNIETNATGVIEPSKYTELGYTYHNTILFNNVTTNWVETNPTITDGVSKVLTTNHTDYRFTYDNRQVDTSIYQINPTYIQSVNLTTDSNLTLQTEFLEDASNVTHRIYSTGMIQDPRELQRQIYDTDITNYASLYQSLRYAEEYIVHQAGTEAEYDTYVNEFFYQAVPSSIVVNSTTFSTPNSVIRQTFYDSIKEYLEIHLKRTLDTALHSTKGQLSYKPEIRKMNYDEIEEIIDTSASNDIMLGNITYTASNATALENDTIHMIQYRHSSRLGVTTSDLHHNSIIQTPFYYFQVSPQLCEAEYNYIEKPTITRNEYDWNETPLFPSSYSCDTGCLIESNTSKRYVNSGTSPTSIRRPNTYGDSIEIANQVASHSVPYWSVGQYRPIIGNYGKTYLDNEMFSQSAPSLPDILLKTQSVVKDALYKPYGVPTHNPYTLSTILSKEIYIPNLELSSSQKDRILPRCLMNKTHLEMVLELHPFDAFFTEWSSSLNRIPAIFSTQKGNYYTHDQHTRPGISEFEYRDPFTIIGEPTYTKQQMDYITNEGDLLGYSIFDFPSLSGDTRRYRENAYKMWNGYTLQTHHDSITFPEYINTVGDRIIVWDSLPWYRRYRKNSSQNMIHSISRELRPIYEYTGFSFPAKYIQELSENEYKHPIKMIQSIDDIQFVKEKDSVKIESSKKIMDIRFMSYNSSELSRNRGIRNSAQRIFFIHPNQPLYNTNQQSSRYLDGGGLWLGTDSIALRYAQYGVDPDRIIDIENVDVTGDIKDNLPVFDPNFTFASETRYPVLVEYPHTWLGLHGTIVDQESVAPHMNTVERPCLIWDNREKEEREIFDDHIFKSIIFDAKGDEIGHEADDSFYHDRFQYEHFDRVTEPNIYGLQFGLGYCDTPQSTGYLNFNYFDHGYFRFITSQKVGTHNTNLEKSLTLDFDMTWQNIQLIRDDMFFTRYIR